MNMYLSKKEVLIFECQNCKKRFKGESLPTEEMEAFAIGEDEFPKIVKGHKCSESIVGNMKIIGWVKA